MGVQRTGNAHATAIHVQFHPMFVSGVIDMTIREKLNNQADADRQDELFALINMLTYAGDIAHSIGAVAAAGHVKSAKEALALEISSSMANSLSPEKIGLLAGLRSGSC